jgi:F420H(2)-dependent quinone reductase
MPLTGEYEPNPVGWVREQVERYQASGGAQANTLRDTGIPIILITARGRRTGKLRMFALMRVEHEGEYAFVASKGGAPEHPAWYHNLVAHPEVMIQDGPTPFDAVVRELDGDERELWWQRSVAVFPPYAEYQLRAADRRIPVLLAGPAKPSA